MKSTNENLTSNNRFIAYFTYQNTLLLRATLKEYVYMSAYKSVTNFKLLNEILTHHLAEKGTESLLKITRGVREDFS